MLMFKLIEMKKVNIQCNFLQIFWIKEYIKFIVKSLKMCYGINCVVYFNKWKNLKFLLYYFML